MLRSGGRPYRIPEGGSDALGSLGYLRAGAELRDQLRSANLRFDTVVTAVGSGGTLAGLVAAHHLWPNELPRPVGINVCGTALEFQDRVRSILREMERRFGLRDLGRAPIDVIDGFVGAGYSLSRAEELRMLEEVAQLEGLVVDPVYSAKALFALLSLVRDEPGRLGDRVVFLHTGGVFGLFPKAGSFQEVLRPDEHHGHT